jgi:hypothetical protein
MDMGKIKQQTIHLLIISAISGVAMGIFFGCKKEIIILPMPTKLLAEPMWDYASGNKIIATLNRGERVEIVGTRFSKDAKFFQVITENGKKGYVMATKEMEMKKNH